MLILVTDFGIRIHLSLKWKISIKQHELGQARHRNQNLFSFSYTNSDAPKIIKFAGIVFEKYLPFKSFFFESTGWDQFFWSWYSNWIFFNTTCFISSVKASTDSVSHTGTIQWNYSQFLPTLELDGPETAKSSFSWTIIVFETANSQKHPAWFPALMW